MVGKSESLFFCDKITLFWLEPSQIQWYLSHSRSHHYKLSLKNIPRWSIQFRIKHCLCKSIQVKISVRWDWYSDQIGSSDETTQRLGFCQHRSSSAFSLHPARDWHDSELFYLLVPQQYSGSNRHQILRSDWFNALVEDNGSSIKYSEVEPPSYNKQ